MKLIVHVDGGSRGNPGPAAIGVVVSAPDGEIVDRANATIGVASNNVAEYKALLLGVERVKEAGATEIEIVNDSELIQKQINGQYKVKHPDMKPLHKQSLAALAAFDKWQVRSVPRAQNKQADELVNQALDGEAVG
ncbi:MAG: ribonuclease HI family protein [Thermoleophilaceae bacterium]|nr:ribonuclease HI family protein [Thermoleophilaceae bacterium]